MSQDNTDIDRAEQILNEAGQKGEQLMAVEPSYNKLLSGTPPGPGFT